MGGWYEGNITLSPTETSLEETDDVCCCCCEVAISTRYRIERVMYRGVVECSIETGSHTAPQPIPRARLKVPVVVGDARRESACWRVSSTARSEQIFVVYRLIDLISSSSIGHIK